MRRESPDSQRDQRKPGSHGRGQRGADAWNRVDRNARLDACLNQLDSGVGNAGRSGIGDQGDRLSRVEAAQSAEGAWSWCCARES